VEKHDLDLAKISEIIEMALSDVVSFQTIRAVHGLGPDAVKALMRRQLKPGSYWDWRKRVRQFQTGARFINDIRNSHWWEASHIVMADIQQIFRPDCQPHAK
jgi:uncharacterized protein (TIGR03643 family)